MSTSCELVTVSDNHCDMFTMLQEAFIGFGGNQVREKVKEGAMWFVYSMRELISVLHEDMPTSPTKALSINGFSNGHTNGANGHTNGANGHTNGANGHNNGAVANGHTNGANGHNNGAVANGHTNGHSEITVVR